MKRDIVDILRVGDAVSPQQQYSFVIDDLFLSKHAVMVSSLKESSLFLKHHALSEDYDDDGHSQCTSSTSSSSQSSTSSHSGRSHRSNISSNESDLGVDGINLQDELLLTNNRRRRGGGNGSSMSLSNCFCSQQTLDFDTTVAGKDEVVEDKRQRSVRFDDDILIAGSDSFNGNSSKCWNKQYQHQLQPQSCLKRTSSYINVTPLTSPKPKKEVEKLALPEISWTRVNPTTISSPSRTTGSRRLHVSCRTGSSSNNSNNIRRKTPKQQKKQHQNNAHLDEIARSVREALADDVEEYSCDEQSIDSDDNSADAMMTMVNNCKTTTMALSSPSRKSKRPTLRFGKSALQVNQQQQEAKKSTTTITATTTSLASKPRKSSSLRKTISAPAVSFYRSPPSPVTNERSRSVVDMETTWKRTVSFDDHVDHPNTLRPSGSISSQTNFATPASTTLSLKKPLRPRKTSASVSFFRPPSSPVAVESCSSPKPTKINKNKYDNNDLKQHVTLPSSSSSNDKPTNFATKSPAGSPRRVGRRQLVVKQIKQDDDNWTTTTSSKVIDASGNKDYAISFFRPQSSSSPALQTTATKTSKQVQPLTRESRKSKSESALLPGVPFL